MIRKLSINNISVTPGMNEQSDKPNVSIRRDEPDKNGMGMIAETAALAGGAGVLGLGVAQYISGRAGLKAAQEKAAQANDWVGMARDATIGAIALGGAIGLAVWVNKTPKKIVTYKIKNGLM